MKNKGNTLIEVIVATSLIVLSVTLVSSIFINGFKYYIEAVELHKEELNINEGLNFIEKEINNLGESVKVRDGEIIMTYNEKYNKRIYLKNGLLRIITSNEIGELKQGNNRILYDPVKDFRISSKNKLLYIEITSMKGNKYNRCLKII